MPTFSTEELLARARDHADMNDDGFVDDAQMLRWANAALPRLDSMIARSGWTQTPSSVTFTANGDDSYDLDGAIPMAVIGVFEVDDGRYRQLVAIPPVGPKHTSPTGDATGFWLEDEGVDPSAGSYVHLRPVPSGGTYVVFYLPQPLTLVATPADLNDLEDDEMCEVTYPNGWEEWLVLQLARRALAREESVNPALDAEQRAIEGEIERMGGDRLFTQGPRVRNVDRVERWSSSLCLPPPDAWTWR